MYKVENLRYLKKDFRIILNNLKETLMYYFTEKIHEDSKEADFWFNWIKKVIKSDETYKELGNKEINPTNNFLCFQITSNEKVVGFVTVMVMENYGLIRHLYVIDTVDKEEVTYILLKETFMKLKHEYGIAEIGNAAFTLPQDYISKPLEKLGYTPIQRINMRLDLPSFNKTYKLPGKFSFASFEDSRFAEVAEVCVDTFEGHIDNTYSKEFSTVDLFLESLEESWNEYLIKECSFIIVNEEDKVVGFCYAERAEEKEIIIQTLAIQKKFQGRGLGKSLMIHILQSLRQKGYEKAILTVTEGNPAKILYEKLGFRKYTKTVVFTPNTIQ